MTTAAWRHRWSASPDFEGSVAAAVTLVLGKIGLRNLRRCVGWWAAAIGRGGGCDGVGEGIFSEARPSGLVFVLPERFERYCTSPASSISQSSAVLRSCQCVLASAESFESASARRRSVVRDAYLEDSRDSAARRV